MHRHTHFSFIERCARLCKPVIDPLIRNQTIRLVFMGSVFIAVSYLIADHPKRAQSHTPDAVEQPDITASAPPAHDSLLSVKKGESLYQIIVDHCSNQLEAHLLSKAFKPHYNPKRIKVGDRYRIAVSTGGQVSEFCFIPDRVHKYIAVRDSQGFQVRKEKLGVESIIKGTEGRIKGSLYESMKAQGIDDEVIMNFAEMFQWNVDFFTEPRNGDSYWVLWEEQTTEDGRSFKGKILAGEYNGKVAGAERGFYMETSQGEKGYFTNNGHSLRRTFLKAPLNYRRISSHFSYRRFHPILRYYRPHTGIDYAAPRGTPVSSIGDGVVTHQGWKGQAGKNVTIRHNSVYTSLYSHLDRYARGIKKGVHVRQGQVIGYVGSTGLATGPHLDFRIKKYGKNINFLKLKLPPKTQISEKDKPAFELQKKRLLRILSELRYASFSHGIKEKEGI
ncbi:MAG: peptidoglycan DD-metalloendopeptidase family protein [Elusimicrobia bacterium]|nr:peptidoglycan DD-metalloendopeptidase family protein [Elusimicrobiota bacterium]MBD3411691.1 peptidoglycan DD-metalloendopeptidase family protein [Elusimicrobiota bacterium]